MTTTWEVIVVGGGLAGLTAGVTAAKGGARTLVLDAGPAGGRARSKEKDGYVFNYGAHALYRGGEGYAILRQLGVEPKGSKPPLRAYKLLVDGELHRMPAGPGSLLGTGALGARSKAKLAKLLGLVSRLDANAVAGTSVDDWVAEQELRADGESVLKALLRINTYGDDFSTLSAQMALVQLQRSAAAGVLYLDGGWEQLVAALRTQVEVRTRIPVRAVRHDGTDVIVETDRESLRARSVVLAPGSPEATAALLELDPAWGDLGPAVTAACLDVATRTVPRPGYVLGVDQPMYGSTHAPPARLAPPGGAVVSVIRCGARGTALDRPELDQWLEHLGVAGEDVVHARFLPRLVVTATAPLARLGGLAGRPTITATGVANVYLAGDWVGHQGFLSDAAFASGHAAGLAAVRACDRSATMVR